MDTNIYKMHEAVVNALDLAEATGKDWAVARFIAELGEQGYAIVAVPPLADRCCWGGTVHHRESDHRDPDGCGWRTLHKFAPVTRIVTETHHPVSGEPHQFHDGEPCFPGCPAWDSKVSSVGETVVCTVTVPPGHEGVGYRLTLPDGRSHIIGETVWQYNQMAEVIDTVFPS